MGYDFKIGEAVLYVPEPASIDSGNDHPMIRVHVEPLRDGSCSAEWDISYGGFQVWAEEVGLEDLFFLKDRPGERSRAGLMPDHPGAARLTPGHLLRFRAALSRARVLGLTDNVPLAEWFVCWTERALAECKIPTLRNS